MWYRRQAIRHVPHAVTTIGYARTVEDAEVLEMIAWEGMPARYRREEIKRM